MCLQMELRELRSGVLKVMEEPKQVSCLCLLLKYSLPTIHLQLPETAFPQAQTSYCTVPTSIVATGVMQSRCHVPAFVTWPGAIVHPLPAEMC